jgi:hypothetical protein
MTTPLSDQPISWDESNDPGCPYRTEWNGKALLLRLNDFPAEPLYTLMVDGQPIGDMNEWPPAWTRPAG